MPQTIGAIAGLWPLALIIGLFIGMLIFRRQLATLLDRLSKFSMKRGQTEVTIESKPLEATVIAELPAPAMDEPPKQEETPKELPAASSEEGPSFGVMIGAIRDHRFDDGQAAFETLQAAEQDPITKLKNEVFYQGASYAQGNTEASLQRIEDIAAAHTDVRAFALGFLAWEHISVRGKGRRADECCLGSRRRKFSRTRGSAEMEAGRATNKSRSCWSNQEVEFAISRQRCWLLRFHGNSRARLCLI